jgi:PAS domain S-box-containing protein
VTARDITETKRAAERMRLSEIRFRRLFEAARDGVLLLDAVSRKITDANPFMTELLGYSRAELLGRELWQIGLLKDEKAGHAAFREIQEKGSVRYEDLPLQSKSGQKREVEVVANLYEENDKQVVQCNIRDITERKAADDRIRLLMDELAHRSKNLMALVQSIASRSLTGARTLEEANNVFAQRIQALARSQSVLLGGGLEGAHIADIIGLESEGFTERMKASGPPIVLNPKSAQTFALLVHELATNATKYGALSNEEGHVAIDWRIEGEAAEARFKFRWQEHDGPLVVPPNHTGFGRTLLERAVAADLDAQSTISFAPEGVRYEIDAPLLAVASE